MKSNWFSGFTQNLAVEITKIVFVLGGGATLFAYWWKQAETLSWPRAVAYSLVVAAAVIVLWQWASIYLSRFKSKESVIRKWIDASVFSSKPETPKSGEEFRLVARNPQGVALTIVGTQKHPNLISIVAKVPVNQANMTVDFQRNVSLELIRQGLQFDMTTAPLHILLQDYVLFDPIAGEHDFIRGALRVMAGVNLCAVLIHNNPSSQSQPIHDATNS